MRSDVWINHLLREFSRGAARAFPDASRLMAAQFARTPFYPPFPSEGEILCLGSALLGNFLLRQFDQSTVETGVTTC